MREDKMLKLLEKGLTYQKIAEQFGVSRQRVHQALRKKFGQEYISSVNKRDRNKLKV